MTRFEKVTTVIAVLISFVCGVIALFIAHQTRLDSKASAKDSIERAAESNRIATDAYGLSARAAERETASKVFLGEAPPKYETQGQPIWAVSNGSGVDISKVWVEGKNSSGDTRYIAIGLIQQCHLYTLTRTPGRFTPTLLHFFDGAIYWQRNLDGSLDKDLKPEKPRDLRPGGDAYIHQMVGGCGG